MTQTSVPRSRPRATTAARPPAAAPPTTGTSAPPVPMSGARRNTLDDVRLCAGCGEPLERRDGEKPSRFARRSTCSRDCVNRAAVGRVNAKAAPQYVEEDRGHRTPCWVWQRSVTDGGYGQMRRAGRTLRAHRVFYEDRHGAIPDGLHLDHLCRVRACVNPDHLEPVTRTENMRRGINTILTEDEVREIRESPLGNRRLARAYGVHRVTILGIRAGRSWKDVV